MLQRNKARPFRVKDWWIATTRLCQGCQGLLAIQYYGCCVVDLYHEGRTHLGLGKDTPGGRVPASMPSNRHKVISLSRLGGLHHRYTVAA